MIKIRIYAKHNDLFSTTVIENDKVIYDKDDYSPGDEYLSICSSSDELEFEIDLETGQIIDWDMAKALNFVKKIKAKENLFGEDEDDNDYNEVEEHNKWLNYEPKLKKRSEEDKVYYTKKFLEAQKEIQQYKDKFENQNLTEEKIFIYDSQLSAYDDIILTMYRLLTVSTLLMKNNIFTKLDKTDDGKNCLIINKSDETISRQLLKENGVYKFKYLRRKNDVHSIMFKY